MLIQLGAAKTPKYATRESGDSLETIERPQGGLSAVLVDGQRSGRNAKIISNIVARKAISLLGEGVRDGAAARAAHDYLVTHRSGQVSAELVILSADLKTRTLVISRNSRCPAHIWRAGALVPFDVASEPIGIRDFTKPAICELPIEAGTYIVVHTDGLTDLDRASGDDSLDAILNAGALAQASAQELADRLLSAALALEQGRPTDDISVLVLAVLDQAPADGVRRLSISLPLD